MKTFAKVAVGGAFFTAWPLPGPEPEPVAALSDQCLAHSWDEAIAELHLARALNDNWDGQGAAAPSIATLDTALKVAISYRDRGELPPDDCGPTVDGAVTFDWQHGTERIHIEVSGPNAVTGYRWSKGEPVADRFRV